MGRENLFDIRPAEAEIRRDREGMMRVMGVEARSKRSKLRSGAEVEDLIEQGSVMVADHPLGIVGFSILEPNSKISVYMMPQYRRARLRRQLVAAIKNTVGGEMVAKGELIVAGI